MLCAAIYAGSTPDHRVRGLVLMAPHFFTEPTGLDAIVRAKVAYETGDLAPNPVPAKAMLRSLGRRVGEPRPPMGPTPPGLDDEARGVHERLVAARG